MGLLELNLEDPWYVRREIDRRPLSGLEVLGDVAVRHLHRHDRAFEGGLGLILGLGFLFGFGLLAGRFVAAPSPRESACLEPSPLAPALPAGSSAPHAPNSKAAATTTNIGAWEQPHDSPPTLDSPSISTPELIASGAQSHWC